MSRIETLLSETLCDPERALPSWVDPIGRVRQARAAQRRRRVTALAAVAVLALGTAVAVPLLREDQKKAVGPIGITEQRPVAVVTGRFVPGAAVAMRDVVLRGASVFAVDGGGAVFEIEREPVAGVERFDLGGSGHALVASADRLFVTSQTPDVYELSSRGIQRLPTSTEPCFPNLSVCAGMVFPSLAVSGQQLVVTARLPGQTTRLVALDLDGKVAASTVLPGTSGDRLAVDGGSVWVRRAGVDSLGGSWLLRFDATTLIETGRVKLPGSLTDGAITAGGGRVWVSSAFTTDVFTTAGELVPIDAATFAVGDAVPVPFALELTYAAGSVWLRGKSLARVDVESGELVGAPVPLDPGAAALCVDDRYVWVAGGQGVTRYDWRYLESAPD